jgi:hypothetical protein
MTLSCQPSEIMCHYCKRIVVCSGMRRVRLAVLQADFIDFVAVDDATQHACAAAELTQHACAAAELTQRACAAAELVGTSDAKLRAVKRAAQLDRGITFTLTLHERNLCAARCAP